MKQQVGPQTFIVKMLIICNMDNRPIYIKQKEGGKRLAVGETESVCERQRVAENEGSVGCKKWPLEKWTILGLSRIKTEGLLNCEELF